MCTGCKSLLRVALADASEHQRLVGFGEYGKHTVFRKISNTQIQAIGRAVYFNGILEVEVPVDKNPEECEGEGEVIKRSPRDRYRQLPLNVTTCVNEQWVLRGRRYGSRS